MRRKSSISSDLFGVLGWHRAKPDTNYKAQAAAYAEDLERDAWEFAERGELRCAECDEPVDRWDLVDSRGMCEACAEARDVDDKPTI